MSSLLPYHKSAMTMSKVIRRYSSLSLSLCPSCSSHDPMVIKDCAIDKILEHIAELMMSPRSLSVASFSRNKCASEYTHFSISFSNLHIPRDLQLGEFQMTSVNVPKTPVDLFTFCLFMSVSDPSNCPLPYVFSASPRTMTPWETG